MLVMLAFTGCQDTNPSMTIVSFQIDSDEEGTWLYLYSIPRVKMGNLTIRSKINRETEIPSSNLKLHIPPEKCCVYEDDKLI